MNPIEVIEQTIEAHAKAIEELNSILNKLPAKGRNKGVVIARWNIEDKKQINNNKNKAL